MKLKKEIDSAGKRAGRIPTDISAHLSALKRWFREAKEVIKANSEHAWQLSFEDYGDELHVEMRACHPVSGFKGRVVITSVVVIIPRDNLAEKIREINSEHERIIGAWHTAARAIEAMKGNS